MAFVAAPLAPNGEPEPLEWSKKKVGHQVTEEGLAFTIPGPGAVVLEVRATKDLRGVDVVLKIVRDGRFVSENTFQFKPKGRGPKGWPLVHQLGFEVPEGEHEYRIEASAPIAVLASTARKVKRKLAAAPEVEVAPPPAPAPEGGDDAKVAGVDPSSSPDGGAEASPVASPEDTDALTDLAASDSPEAAGTTSNDALRPKRVAVYDAELEGVDPNIGTVVTDSILAEVRKLQGISAIGMDEIRDMLSHEANKQILGCEADDACLAEIAGALGVDELVTGKLSRAADSHVFLLRRIDQGRARVVGVVNKRLKAESGQEFLLTIGPSVEELFPDRPLREGAKRGVPAEVALKLDPPPLPVWSFWTAAGLTGATAAAGGVFGLLFMESQKVYKQYGKQATTTPIAGSDVVGQGKIVQRNAATANALFIGAAALAVTTGVWALFTDWHGYGEAR